jgi:dienelactone hydrolase
MQTPQPSKPQASATRPEAGQQGPTRRALMLGLVGAGLAGPACARPRHGLMSGPDAEGRSLWRVPAGRANLTQIATLVRPKGLTRPRLALIAHGSTEIAAERAAFPLPAYGVLTGWLLARGYAVLLPQRPGHGDTGGPYLEAQGPCEAPDYAKSGRATAATMAAALTFIRARPELDLDPRHSLVIGASAGGWGALALAGNPPPGVSGIVAFAPGRGGRSYNQPGLNCAPERLVETAAAFGRAARVPGLLIAATNDSFFPRALARRIAEAFLRDPRSRFVLTEPFGAEGHTMVEEAAALPLWAPALSDFLDRIG